MLQMKNACEDYYNAHDEEHLLKSINKLLTYLKTNEKTQKEIFINLSDKGLNKILLGIKDEIYEIRILSFKLLLDLLNNNEVLQNIFCEKFNFNPIGPVICINWFPKCLRDNIKFNEKIINEIKGSIYTINDKRNKYWMWPNNTKYNDENFPDPLKYLLGFYFTNKSNTNNLTGNKKSSTKNTYIVGKKNSNREVNKAEDKIMSTSNIISNNIITSSNNEDIDIRQLNFMLEKSTPENYTEDVNTNNVNNNYNNQTKSHNSNYLLNNNKSNKKIIAAGSGSESSAKISQKLSNNNNVNNVNNINKSETIKNNKVNSINMNTMQDNTKQSTNKPNNLSKSTNNTNTYKRVTELVVKKTSK